jgi:hypothetical protein
MKESKYTGKVELDWKDGEVVGWVFPVREKPKNGNSERKPFSGPLKTVGSYGG